MHLVEKLVGFRISEGMTAGDTHRKGTKLYKVRWVGCAEDEDSWEPMSKIAPQLVSEFNSIAQPAQPEGPTAPTSPASSKRPRNPQALSPSAKSPDANAAAFELEIEALD